MRRIILALAILSMALVPTQQANALMKAHCKPSVGTGNFDPIVQHNSDPTSHNHTFFANTTLLNNPNPNTANYADLVGSGTTCQNSDDTASYWIPTLLFKSTGKPVPGHAMIAYYRSFDHKTKGIAEPIPADLRMVAGNAGATTPQDIRQVNWTCNQNSSRPGPYISPTAANCSTATGTVYLTAHIDFPSCWDGNQNNHETAGNTADFSGTHQITQHLAYANGSQCPQGFSHKLAELRVTVNWNYQGNGSNVYLSSDPQNGPYGLTMHADFWNTWTQTGGHFGGMVGMVKDCINTTSGSAIECG